MSYGQCTGDLDSDSTVSASDLAIALSGWGAPGVSDINLDGTTDGGDLALLFSHWGALCNQPIVDVRLACVPLSIPPFASYVQTFVEGTAVHVAIDLTLTPLPVPLIGRLYVIDARSAAQWAANDALVDVRGSAQEVFVQSGSVDQNRFMLDQRSAPLSGDGGLALGHGYDLVIDLNGDGRLSGGDLIDGRDDRAAIWMTRDPAQRGPLEVTSVSSYTASGVTSGFTQARLWYPTSIATLSPRPLVVLSHGNLQQYLWYDYLAEHLASWGYIVISHQNNTVPGVETASTTTLQHTNAILSQQATIAGGALSGKIDSSRIVWIGHSRGGEGVVRAYDRLYDNTYTPTQFSLNSVKFLCAIAPTDLLGANSAHPHAANFMLLWGSADGDVSGNPVNTSACAFNIAERSVGFRNTVYIHGADHNDFTCCGYNDFVGPAETELGNEAAQAIAKAFILVGVKVHVDQELPLKEYLWRPNATLRPPQIASTTTIVKELLPPPSANVRVIDNFQTQTSQSMSSSGGTVSSTVSNISEAKARDTDASFGWSAADAHNGSTRTTSNDSQRMLACDWTSSQRVEWSIPNALMDVSGFDFVELRVAQGTRHPNTVALNGQATFTLMLRDAVGTEARVSSSAQGDGINLPYQRIGDGAGLGWQNELRTIRLRLRDFQAEGTGIQLGQLKAVRLEVGEASGSAIGRFIVDDLQFTKE